MILISRETEEIALSRANGTCANRDKCVSPTVIPGTAIANGKCVLCCRYETTKTFNDLFDFGVEAHTNCEAINPYTNITNDYRKEVLLDITDKHSYKCISGPFVKYNEDDYTLIDDLKVVQNFKPVKTIHWINTLINIEKQVLPINKGWSIAYCKTTKCKKKVFSIIDQQSATGMTDTVYNLNTGTIQCSSCKVDINVIHSNDKTGLVTYNEEDYTKCSFCNTIVKFDVFSAPPTCTSCLNSMVKRAQDAKKVCLYCNIHVNTSRRGGNKSVVQPDGSVIYLCKVHSKNFVSN